MITGRIEVGRIGAASSTAGRLALSLACLLVAGCREGTDTMEDSERREVREAVVAAMRSFEAAERALDAEAAIAHFADVPDFHMYNDGERLDYETLASTLQSGFPALRSLEGGFHDLQVFVLAPDAALATAGFREAYTDSTGATTRLRGAATWLWRRIEGEWKIVYGHADHYPDEEPEPDVPSM